MEILPLLQTKLYIPQTRPADVVPRPHLLERLNEGLTGQLTLISAVAGSGKTTVVGDWLRQ
jgi:LuxR family maltose regulon positive regulatory protein